MQSIKEKIKMEIFGLFIVACVILLCVVIAVSVLYHEIANWVKRK